MAAAITLFLTPAVGSAAEPNVVELDVPDVELVDHHGAPGRFVSELIGDRLVAITFTFSHCTTICPTLDGIFKQLQERVADDLGSGTSLLTVSLDPSRDIPERLAHHAHHLGALDGWRFLTGEKRTVTRLLKSLEVFAPNLIDHPPTVFVVDGRRDVWTRLYGFPTPDTIVDVLDTYKAARAEGAEEALAP